jgi:hypothetical protein
MQAISLTISICVTHGWHVRLSGAGKRRKRLNKIRTRKIRGNNRRKGME